MTSQGFESSYGGDGSKLADDTRLECGICWWVYDPALGDEETQTPPGTPFRLLNDTWTCPNCAADKSKFMVIDSATINESDSVNNLANAYRRAALKVKGLPIYNPTLAVEAVGFREHEGRQVGVIVTPWFMNLTILPSAADLTTWVDGGTARIAFPSGLFDFVVADLHGVGLIGTCSLFSTMTEFTDHEAAQVAARSVAEALFEPDSSARPDQSPLVSQISRRKLLGG